MDSIALQNRPPAVVAYFDVDCFYAQSEILRRPHLRHSPVGVTQKSLVVTCNYVARELGVPKMASIQEAKQRCPNLVLFNGEDLTPYRAASKNIMAVIARFGVLERRGLDEAALDITSEVLRRARSMPIKNFSGHVIGFEMVDENENDSISSHWNNCADQSDIEFYHIMVGSQIVAEIRAAVEKETGFQCSSGIASNKMLAKMVSSVNKPNKQTSILSSGVSAFLKPLHVRKLPGVGHRTESMLNDMGVTTLADLQQISLSQLSTRFGSRMGTLLYENCRGVDNSHVQNKGPPKSLSVEDSFQPCSTFKQAKYIVKRLAADLIVRLDEDKREYVRRPNSITVKWRYQGNWSFKSTSAAMPLEVLSTSISTENRVEIVVLVATKLLMNSIGKQPFSIVVLNIGASNFVSDPCESEGASRDIRSFFKGRSQVFKCVSKVVSDFEPQSLREEYENICLPSIQSNIAQNWRETDHAQVEMKLDVEEQLEDRFFGEDCEKLYFPSIQSNIVKPCGEMVRIQGGWKLDTGDEWIVKQSMEEKSILQEDLTSGSCIKRVDNAHVEVIEPVTAELEEEQRISSVVLHENLPGNGTHFSGSLPFDINNSRGGRHQFICEKCGQEIDCVGPQSRQEHDDYHLALDLDLQEQESDWHAQSSQVHDDHCLASSLSSQQRVSANSTTQPLMHPSPGGKRKISNCSSKKRRIQNGTLDCFVYRSKRQRTFV